MKKNKEWAFIELGKLFPSHAEMYDCPDNITVMKCELLNKVYDILSQLDEPETLSQGYNQQAYRDGFKEGERQTAEYFESITEEPSKEQVWKYLSERGIEVVDKEPETVASVIADFYKSLERLKGVLGTEVEELEE